MNGSDPFRPMTQRAWSWALSLLGIGLVLNLAWALIRPLLPVLLVAVVVVAAVVSWQRWRWR